MKSFDEQPIKLKHIIGRVVKQNRGFSFIWTLPFLFGMQGLYVILFVLAFRFTFYSNISLSSQLQFCMDPRLSFTEIPSGRSVPVHVCPHEAELFLLFCRILDFYDPTVKRLK